jgi:hypothetical protein
MTTFIALPDLHDHPESLKKIARPLMQADVVLLPGDMTNGNMNHLLRLFTILTDLNEHVYTVPGNMDTVKMLAHLAREGYNIHHRFEVLDGLALVGLGGALPFDGKFVFSEEETAQLLNDAIEDLPTNTPTLLVSHQPPYGSKLDVLSNGMHVGSKSVRAWIEQHQPLVCVCGHIHEAVGVDHIGNTILINPGPLWVTNSYAYFEIENGRVLTAEIRQAPAEATKDAEDGG